MRNSRDLRVRRAVAVEVKAAIERAGKSVTEVAAASGIAQTTLYRKLKGDTAFNVDEMSSLARVLGVEARRFMPDAATVAEVRMPEAVGQ